MTLEFGIWRIDKGLKAVDFSPLEVEGHLEDILERDITVAAPNWMVIGRQVPTAYGKFIDLLAIDPDGNPVVLELKRDMTYRDIVSQVLDYGSWVKELRTEHLAGIFDAYLKKYHPQRAGESLDQAFCARFKVKAMPEDLNTAHQLVIVASSLDPSTERVVKYLDETYGVQINAIFFRAFKDDDREYLARAWLSEPTLVASAARDGTVGEWNGEYYGSFGADGERVWDEAVKYGFFSAGGGSWYTKTLSLLQPGARLWVNVPATGYVGVGEVLEEAVVVDEFMVTDDAGKQLRLIELPVRAANMRKEADDPEIAEYLVRMKWLATEPVNRAVKEKGFFGNQNTVAKPRTPKWDFTVQRLKQKFGIE
jgi:hypothetical protein